MSTLTLAFGLMAGAGTAAAQALPVSIEASGNVAHARIGLGSTSLADVTLSFQDASNLNAASVGISAEQLNLADPTLLARLPAGSLTQIASGLPVMITVEPPASGGLSFRNTGRMEIHTHALPYTVGSSLRVFKAPLGGSFRDVTDEIAQGSVRARSTYGGFSQFLIVSDLRPTADVVAEKVARLRTNVDALPAAEQAGFDTLIDNAESAVARADYADAIANVDALKARALERGGSALANEWRASRDVTNHAGEIAANAATLRFSVAYLRDFGQ
ncbi:hypothetical protein GCM10007067_11550 [Lysobacter bugurensis]|uniref:Uncharacterized protein n=2 Tax=Cognatilysobacter bugurensis TaxID=543356 RepID=A0A918SXK4_9GAMM|nr:hypothetical protein GCM10007067_11550 [Lysobacter bugurensis]